MAQESSHQNYKKLLQYYGGKGAALKTAKRKGGRLPPLFNLLGCLHCTSERQGAFLHYTNGEEEGIVYTTLLVCKGGCLPHIAKLHRVITESESLMI